MFLEIGIYVQNATFACSRDDRDSASGIRCKERDPDRELIAESFHKNADIHFEVILVRTINLARMSDTELPCKLSRNAISAVGCDSLLGCPVDLACLCCCSAGY